MYIELVFFENDIPFTFYKLMKYIIFGASFFPLYKQGFIGFSHLHVDFTLCLHYMANGTK